MTETLGHCPVEAEWASEKPTADREELRLAAHRAIMPVGMSIFGALGSQDAYERLLDRFADEASGAIQPANLHAAKVLRDAASECSVNNPEGLRVHAWLRARADRIEAGK